MPKVIFNITYTNATPPASYTGNKRAEYIAERNFYNLTSEYNYFSYSLDGKKVAKNANAEHYFTREGTNSGLFNLDGPINEEKKSEIKAQLKDTESPIWHGFISFDATASLGFQTQENCVKFMRQTFGGFLTRAGFALDNVELYCSLHEDTEHRHIHYAFFEKMPKHYNSAGKAGVYRQGFIGNKIIDNYLVSANMHLSERGAEYYTARDEAFAELKRVRDVHGRTGTFTSTARSENLELNLAFDRLIEKLPKTGRLQYGAENMANLRPEIDALAERLIRSDSRAYAAHVEMQKQFARVNREMVDLALDNKLAYVNDRRMTKEEVRAVMGGKDTRNKRMPVKYLDLNNIDYLTRLKADYMARLGNLVLGICKDIKVTRRRAFVNDRHLKIDARQRRKKKSMLFRQVKEALSAACAQESANFLKTVKEIEFENEVEAGNVTG